MYDKSQPVPGGTLPVRHSRKDKEAFQLLEHAFEACPLRNLDKLEAFPRFVSKRSLARFLCKYEIYKQILKVNGIIIECGVFNGAGLFTWAQLANIFEPSNYNRRIVGFDTFKGFPSVALSDTNESLAPAIGDLHGDAFEFFNTSLQKYNAERHLAHIPNIELIEGDFLKTGEEYLTSHQHTLVSLLYLDFDLYEPTAKALELFLPRMPKGAVVCFDELNCPNFPGETTAAIEKLDLTKRELHRFPEDPWISYVVL
jgi:hypothetical protein